jgi:hypothetical protein
MEAPGPEIAKCILGKEQGLAPKQQKRPTSLPLNRFLYGSDIEVLPKVARISKRILVAITTL